MVLHDLCELWKTSSSSLGLKESRLINFWLTIECFNKFQEATWSERVKFEAVKCLTRAEQPRRPAGLRVTLAPRAMAPRALTQPHCAAPGRRRPPPPRPGSWGRRRACWLTLGTGVKEGRKCCECLWGAMDAGDGEECHLALLYRDSSFVVS